MANLEPFLAGWRCFRERRALTVTPERDMLRTIDALDQRRLRWSSEEEMKCPSAVLSVVSCAIRWGPTDIWPAAYAAYAAGRLLVR